MLKGESVASVPYAFVDQRDVCERCTAKTERLQVCTLCEQGFCEVCSHLGPMKNPCSSGSRHVYSSHLAPSTSEDISSSESTTSSSSTSTCSLSLDRLSQACPSPSPSLLSSCAASPPQGRLVPSESDEMTSCVSLDKISQNRSTSAFSEDLPNSSSSPSFSSPSPSIIISKDYLKEEKRGKTLGRWGTSIMGKRLKQRGGGGKDGEGEEGREKGKHKEGRCDCCHSTLSVRACMLCLQRYCEVCLKLGRAGNCTTGREHIFEQRREGERGREEKVGLVCDEKYFLSVRSFFGKTNDQEILQNLQDLKNEVSLIL